MIWARKKIGDPVVRLNSVIEAEAFAKKYSMFVLGLFEKFEVIFFLYFLILLCSVILVWGFTTYNVGIGYLCNLLFSMMKFLKL